MLNKATAIFGDKATFSSLNIDKIKDKYNSYKNIVPILGTEDGVINNNWALALFGYQYYVEEPTTMTANSNDSNGENTDWRETNDKLPKINETMISNEWSNDCNIPRNHMDNYNLNGDGACYLQCKKIVRSDGTYGLSYLYYPIQDNIGYMASSDYDLMKASSIMVAGEDWTPLN